MQALISESVSQIIGLCGVLTYLLAYALLQSGVIGGNGYLYAAMNAAAACMVMVSLIHAFNLASLLIQVSFVLISILGILRVAFLTRSARFSDDERAMMNSQFPDLPSHLGRKLFNAGTWARIPPGTIITQEGEHLDRLTYIAAGEVRILVRDQVVGYRGANTFIGEISFMDASPATATVVVTEPVTGFVIAADALQALIDRHMEIRLAMTASFSANTRDTLRERTDEIARGQTVGG